MNPYIKILRPGNCIMGMFAVYISSVIILGELNVFLFDQHYLDIILAFITVFLFTGAGNALNDYLDRDIDRKNHPERPIPSGKVKPEQVMIFSLVLFGLALFFGFMINILTFMIVLINLIVMLAYEFKLKNIGLIGNLSISWLSASLFLFGGLAILNSFSADLEPIWILFTLAFFATLAREIIKDIQDMRGDIGRSTLPKQIGMEKSGYIAIAALIMAMVISPIPYILEMFAYPYLIVIILADAIFLYSGYILKFSPKKAAKLAKYAMMIALLAFIVGGFIS